MSTISGTVSHACRIHIYDLTDNTLEVDEEIAAGSYSYPGLESNQKWVSAMKLSDGQALSYGDITPTADPPVEADFPVLIDEDDAFYNEGQPSSTFDTGWDNLRFVNSSYWVCVRTDNVTIPKDALILEAWLDLTWDTVQTDRRAPCWVNVHVESAVDPTMPQGIPDLTGRTRLTPVVIGFGSSLTDDTYIPFQSPSLVTQIQTIVNQGSWSQGNAINFIMDKTSGTYSNGLTSFSSGNGTSSLHVKYQSL